MVDLDELERDEADESELAESYNNEYDLRESSDVKQLFSVEAEAYPKSESDSDNCE